MDTLMCWPWTVLDLYGFLEQKPLQCSDAWKVTTWLSLIFSDMICMNTCVIARVVYVYPLHSWPDHVMPYILNTCRAWPMTWPLHISMIMHELLNKLKTSVYWSMLMSPWSCDMTIRNMAGAATSTGRMVREKLSNLLCLTRCGFCVHLEEDGQLYPNMSM